MAQPGDDDHGDFRLSTPGIVLATIRRLQREATAEGRGAEFTRAMKIILSRLAKDPFVFGEALRSFDAIDLELRCGAVSPVYIVSGVHKSEAIVFIRDVKLLSLPD